MEMIKQALEGLKTQDAIDAAIVGMLADPKEVQVVQISVQ
ncbi:hypothetical protein CCACVL1_23235 [Corchorus capsularis]|uniref:Uncharacterized protein n=1 Tax=Corchorus capsularis TaxID=210143 RepID=A0A1R3GUJ5_COCAP|nr:hypothetical protein CCACVL1_23235 [Corchorus capsularis]